MKHMKTVLVPEQRNQVVDFVTCDLCGEKPGAFGYDINEVEVRHKTGILFPEGGSGTETRVDMCGKCFARKLVPWLISQGCSPSTEDWERDSW